MLMFSAVYDKLVEWLSVLITLGDASPETDIATHPDFTVFFAIISAILSIVLAIAIYQCYVQRPRRRPSNH